MPIRFDAREQLALTRFLGKWCILGAWVGLLAGSASALFLSMLDRATNARLTNPWLLWLLPIGGALIALLYERFGQSVEGGNNLLLDRIHRPDAGVPARMAPLVLIATVATHLFGGSAGREGTAVQMGGSLATLVARPLKLGTVDRRLLIMAGISGGFGSVFGTPLAGMIFGLEVLTVGRIDLEGIVACLVASFVGDAVCRAWGIGHTQYRVDAIPNLTPQLVALILLAAALFAIASMAFSELTDLIHRTAKKTVPAPWLRTFGGGTIVVVLALAVGSRDYLGLSIPLLSQSFRPEGVVLWAFVLKMLFTSITLGTGFKGGEVTPLFVIGATLGCAFAKVTHQPTSYFAALGFVSVFAGAANTPLACIAMGIELFGAPMGAPLALACVVAYVLSGHRGIYLSQRVGTPKAHSVLVGEMSTLRDTRDGAREVLFSGLAPKVLLALTRREPIVPATRSMQSTHLQSSAFGMIRIFVKTGERRTANTLKDKLLAKPLHLEIIQAAKDFGLPHGVVRPCIAGFSSDTKLHGEHAEYDNPYLPLYIELHGTREELHGFCHQRADLLKGRTILFKEMENWTWHDGSRADAGRKDEEAALSD